LIESVTVDDEENAFLYLRLPAESASHFIPKWIPTKRCLAEMLEWVGLSDLTEIPSETSDRTVYLAKRPSD
ncbi:MAG: hypothetical protein QOC92_3893, partial [Acidimicrobiaceae bacterium]